MEILNIIVIVYLAVLVIGVLVFYACVKAESGCKGGIGLFGLIAIIIMAVWKYYIAIGCLLGIIYFLIYLFSN